MNPSENFDLDTLVKYGNRKKPGRVSFFVDIVNQQIFPVPNTGLEKHEHKCYGPKLKKQQKISLDRLVPVHVDTDGQSVTGLETGYSGMELALNVRHSREDLEEAHRLVRDYVLNGTVPVLQPLSSDKIEYRYSYR